MNEKVKLYLLKKHPELEEAINDIYYYNTMPHQIDYRRDERIKAREAEELIREQPDYIKDMCFKMVSEKIEEYHCSDAAYYDSLF